MVVLGGGGGAVSHERGTPVSCIGLRVWIPGIVCRVPGFGNLERMVQNLAGHQVDGPVQHEVFSERLKCPPS